MKILLCKLLHAYNNDILHIKICWYTKKYFKYYDDKFTC